MACTTCSKIRRWIANKLGMDDMYAATRKADEELATNMRILTQACIERITAVENEMRGNYQKQAKALNELDEASGKYLESLTGTTTKLSGQIKTLSESIRNERADRRAVSDKLDELSTEVGELAEDLRKVEFPEPAPIDMTLSDD